MLQQEIIKRKIIEKIDRFIYDDEILVILGSRQVGKTSLLFYLIKNYIEKVVQKNNIFYFDLEDFVLLELCNSSVEDVVEYIKTKGANLQQKVFLLIDEVQYLSDPTSFLKLLYDKYKGKIKLIVSGSSSLLLKKKLKVSLVGRAVEFELHPLSFEEFLWFKNLNYDLYKKDYPEAVHSELRKHFLEYIYYGGYPAIVLEEDVQKKEIKLKQIISTYVKKDIRDIGNIKDIEKFNSLLQILSSQTGNLLNILELSNTLGISSKTIKDYLILLEGTYIVKRITPFYKNIRSELTKMPKIFFEDTGVANLVSNKTFLTNVEDKLLETAVFCEIRKNYSSELIHYWRTQTKQEIDFVVEIPKKRKLIAIEVKQNFLNKYTHTLERFSETYKDTELYFCCLYKKEESKNKKINVIYPWQITGLLEEYKK